MKNMLYIPSDRKNCKINLNRHTLLLAHSTYTFIFYIHTYCPTFKKNLTRPITVDGKPQFYDVEANVFIKTIKYDLKVNVDRIGSKITIMLT